MLARLAPLAPRAFVRYNSSTTSRTSRIVEMAARVEKPSALEAAVPVMWALCGALTVTAWNRMDGRMGDEVERLIIV